MVCLFQIFLYRRKALRSDPVQQRRQLRLFFGRQPLQRGTLGLIRFGGEEFAVVFNIQLATALSMAGVST